MLSYQVVLNTPFMKYDQYSQFSGMPKRTIMDWVADGRLPIPMRSTQDNLTDLMPWNLEINEAE